jgi:cobalt-zinc-cadmium efflux system membrane fusion protein
MRHKKLWFTLLLIVVMTGIYTIFPPQHNLGIKNGEHATAPEEFERGPHRGRMLRKKDFAIEITIFEDNVPPEYHIYAYDDGKPLAPDKVQLAITLNRLDGEVNTFNFVPQNDFLKGDSVVHEPHSFDVKVEATYKGKTYNWAFASYEGRTKIDAAAATAAGIKTEKAGPSLIRETLPLTGRIVLNRNTTANVKARFPGIVKSVKKEQGEAITSEDVLATVESNDSLQVYSVKSPLSGIVLSRNTNIGEVTSDAPLFVVANLSDVWAEFHVFPRDTARVQIGQKVHVSSIKDVVEGEGTIISLVPLMESATQTVVARVLLDNSKKCWRPGMAVQGKAIVNEREVPIAVKTSGLQTFHDFSVVFAQIGETYEVRMLKLGVNDGENVEVLEGIKPDTSYVSGNSFLIKADIEKSGATHDH